MITFVLSNLYDNNHTQDKSSRNKLSELFKFDMGDTDPTYAISYMKFLCINKNMDNKRELTQGDSRGFHIISRKLSTTITIQMKDKGKDKLNS